MPTIIIHKLALCDAALTVYPVSVASSGACISNGRICSNSITVYLSEAVYRPGDLGKIYDKATVPPVSKPKAAPPAWLQPINKAYDLIPPTGTLNAVGHILAHKRELRVNVDPCSRWHSIDTRKTGASPAYTTPLLAASRAERSPSGSAVTVLNKPILSMA